MSTLPAGASPPRSMRSEAARSGRRWRPQVARRPWASVRVRITLVATLVFGLAFAGAAFVLVQRVQGSLESAIERENDAAIRAITSQIDAGVAPPDALLAARPYNLTVVAFDDAGRPIGGTATGAGAATTAPLPGQALDGRTLFMRARDGRDVLVSTENIATERGTVTLVAESPLASVQTSVATITGILVVGTPLLVAGFAVMVWVLVGRALRPVEAMRAEVTEITHTTMHRRVREPGTQDEVDRLAVTMNEMLDRLEAASERQRRFVSDASHELKTPLATIRTSLEVALRDPDRADWPATAQQVLDADRSMADLVANLLDLARLEEDGPAPLPAGAPTVDLEEVVMAVVADRPGEQRAAIDVGGVLAGRVRGDRGDLERLVRNLVDNAERYGSGRVAIALAESPSVPEAESETGGAGGGAVRLAVADDGPGIAPEDRERVFDRFTRLDDSRTSGAGGTGLGLAIVRAIAERHGGSVQVGDGPLGGAELVVTLPAA